VAGGKVHQMDVGDLAVAHEAVKRDYARPRRLGKRSPLLHLERKAVPAEQGTSGFVFDN
jgi:nucleoside phosphorylase